MVSIKRVFKTLFPRLGVSATCNNDASYRDDCTSTVPDLEDLTDVSHDGYELEPASSNNGFKCKEDEDVAMFLSLVDRMAVKSLLFILQNHAREMHNIPEQQLQLVLGDTKHGVPRRGSFLGANSNNKGRTGFKKCRFAEIMGGQQVRGQVFEIPHLNDLSEEEKQDVWYSTAENKSMRLHACKAVKYYKTNCPSYASSVRVLAESYDPAADEMVVEQHIKRIAQDPRGRGLEPHLCELPQVCRAASVQAVLSEQEKQRLRRKLRSPLLKKGKTVHLEGETKQNLLLSDTSNRSLVRKPQQGGGAPCDESTESRNSITSSVISFNSTPRPLAIPLDDPMLEQDMERIRNCYRERTLACRTLALRLAECDHVEALKASLLRWHAPSMGGDCNTSSSSLCKQESARRLTSHVSPLSSREQAA